MLLQKFDITKIKDNNVIVILGKRGKGKSFLTKDILYHQNIQNGVVLSHKSDNNIEILNNLLEEQKKQNSNHTFLVIEDNTLLLRNDEFVSEKIINGKFLHILTIIELQYFRIMSYNLWKNIDYLFIFNDELIVNRQRIYKSYEGLFGNFETFCSLMDKLGDYECLVIDQIENCVYFYKAAHHENKL